MIDIRELREKVEAYAKDKIKDNTYLFDPIFRKEEDKYYLWYTVLQFIDEKNNNYDFKKPTHFIIVDFITGDIIKLIEDKELFNEEIKNDGSSSLYDSTNYILTSYFEWKNKVLNEVEKRYNFIDNAKDPKILLSKDSIISPNSFVLANAESILEELHLTLVEKIGNEVQKMYIDYYIYLIDTIRKEYLENNSINEISIINYINLLKYSWPSFSILIDKMSNINVWQTTILLYNINT